MIWKNNLCAVVCSGVVRADEWGVIVTIISVEQLWTASLSWKPAFSPKWERQDGCPGIAGRAGLWDLRGGRRWGGGEALRGRGGFEGEGRRWGGEEALRGRGGVEGERQSGFTRALLGAHSSVSSSWITCKVVEMCTYGCGWYGVWVVVTPALALVFWLGCPLCRIHWLNVHPWDLTFNFGGQMGDLVQPLDHQSSCRGSNKVSDCLRADTVLSLVF